MKKNTLILAIFISLTSYSLSAQIYGNTLAPDFGSYGGSTVLWLKIETGPSDSGEFTHYGLYNHPTQGADCDVRHAIYSDHPDFDRPQDLLSSRFHDNPANGAYNEIALITPLTLSPSTTYWMGLRTDCNYGGGRIAGDQWPIQPLKYIDSYSFISGWPDPVNPSTLNTWGQVNHVTWWIVANNMTLPAELTSFEIKNEKNTAVLEWETATEINNDGWNIQRSTNGFSWNTIGFVEGKVDSHEPRSYKYQDDYDRGGLVFYRLEQVDLDGTTTYSEVRKMVYSAADLYVYPTQADDRVTIGGLEEDTNYSIATADGTIVRESTTAPNERIDVSELANGLHFLILENETFTFIKQ